MKHDSLLHISDLELDLYISGYLFIKKDRIEEIQEHIADCEICQDYIMSRIANNIKPAQSCNDMRYMMESIDEPGQESRIL